MLDAFELIDRAYRLKSDRTNFENQWQELKDLMRPSAKDFLGNSTSGQEISRKVFDGTAMWAADQLGSGLCSYTTPDNDRWFNLRVGDERLMRDREVLLWLEYLADHFFYVYASPNSRFKGMIHEARMDAVVFGTSILYQDRQYGYPLPRFRTLPLADCYIDVNYEGDVVALYRCVQWTTAQAMDCLKERCPQKIQEEKDPFKSWEFWHITVPGDTKLKKGRFNTNMPYASVWVCKDTKEIVRESGYLQFPYHINRWGKSSDEMYGRSPAMNCLPDIRMLNEMAKTVLKGAQKVVDPPLQVPSDGFILPIRTSPGATLFHEPGIDRIEPLITNGRVEIGLDMMDQRRQAIIRAFHVDWLQMDKKDVEMTAFEASDRRDEKLRSLGPLLGRMQSDELSPMLLRTYELEKEAGHLVPPPPALAKAQMQIEYVSPAAVAQMATKSLRVSQFLQDLAPIAQIDPSVLDIVDMDQTAMLMVETRDITRKVIRTPEQVASRRDQREKQQQLAQATEAGVGLSQTAKNLAQAKQVAANAA